jgi:hypothetical protein
VPSLGHIAGSLAVALTVTLLFLFWIGWPGFLAVGAGAIFGTAFLVVATSLGVDPRAADEAWRQRAGDLTGARPAAAADGHLSAVPPAAETTPDEASDGAPSP